MRPNFRDSRVSQTVAFMLCSNRSRQVFYSFLSFSTQGAYQFLLHILPGVSFGGETGDRCDVKRKEKARTCAAKRETGRKKDRTREKESEREEEGVSGQASKRTTES